MHKPSNQQLDPIDLSDESISTTTPFSFEVALARGIIVEVTDWVTPDIGFGRGFYRTRVALTARVWDGLLQAQVRSINGSLDWEERDRRNDIVWLAAQALQRAGGANVANFPVYLPLTGGIEDCKMLRVECKEKAERGYSQALIGYPEDFARL